MAGTGFNIGLDGHLARPLTERQAEDIAEGLHIIYTRARENMLQAVAKRMERGITRPGWATEKASEVMAAHQQLAVQMEQAARAREGLLSGILERAANTGSQRFYRDMAAVVGAAGQISPNASKVGYILADLNNSLNAAERRILRQFDDAYSDIIAGASAELATGTVTARQAVGKALRSFADNGIDGFTDRAGRHWQMETYAEMATLTAIERASIAGYVDTMQSYGYDLAVIDGHAGSCPVCTAWEGVIISVSGEADGYPSLSDAEAAGCFHPRCLHDIHTYYEGVTHEPAGGFRTAPREIQPAGKEYTARSIQRYMERQVRKYKDRQRVAITPQDELQARNMARRWQERLRQHVDAHKDKVLLRHYDREGGRVALSEAAKQLQYDVKSGKIPMQRRVGNSGAYSHLPEAMSKKHIRQVAKEVGISLDGITLNIQKSEEFLKDSFFITGSADYTAVGTIDFFPKAFQSKEELIRTMFHELQHVRQYREYGVEYVQNNREHFERLAYEAEDAFVSALKKEGKL